ncbi:hypothetical protein HMPREF1018_01632 [Bacteroides fragilis]|nr:hypothetical protein HMPREF1018_01632 [Bacteroides fragilis]
MRMKSISIYFLLSSALHFGDHVKMKLILLLSKDRNKQSLKN